MAQSTLAELERTGQGSSKTLQIAAACGVSPEWLATGSEKKISAAWPLVGVVAPDEWPLLPPEVREDALAAVEHYITRHRKKAGHQTQDAEELAAEAARRGEQHIKPAVVKQRRKAPRQPIKGDS